MTILAKNIEFLFRVEEEVYCDIRQRSILESLKHRIMYEFSSHRDIEQEIEYDYVFATFE